MKTTCLECLDEIMGESSLDSKNGVFFCSKECRKKFITRENKRIGMIDEELLTDNKTKKKRKA